MHLSDRPKLLTLSTAESLQNGTPILRSSADSLRAELQVLLAEVKRLSLHQEYLKQNVAALDLLEASIEAAIQVCPNLRKEWVPDRP
ncbi:MAG: hypothetical protein FRX49_12491 [Trebouxia sp. A1-2]|nr:MAG: hypothetical protein FRX49_12491 [Trebouxia sp. A1-2]